MMVSLFFPRSEFIILSLGQHAYRTATQKLELAIYLYILGQPRFQGSLYCFESEPWERGCSGMSVTDVIWCDVKVHFKVVKQHGFKCEWYVLFMKGWRLYSSSVKQCLLYIGESRPISQATKRARPTQERSIEQVAGNPRRGRFTIETPLQRERRLEIQRQKRKRRRARTLTGC